MDVKIRNAQPQEAAQLNRLAFAAKAHWGYDEEFMAACRAELSYQHKIPLSSYRFRVLECQGEIIGFYALERLSRRNVEIEAMFVAPQYIGQGHGRRLMQDAIRQAREMGAKLMIIQSDPHAQGFYHAAGARHVGQRPSHSIPGRNLPLMHLVL